MTYADQDPLVLDVDVSDGQLAGERHVGDGSKLKYNLNAFQR